MTKRFSGFSGVEGQKRVKRDAGVNRGEGKQSKTVTTIRKVTDVGV